MIAAVAVVAMLAIVPAGASGTAVARSSVIAPTTDTEDEYLKALQEAKRILDEAASSIPGDALDGGNGLLAQIDEADAIIQMILDPFRAPVLDPPDAGEADETIQPNSLSEYANACCVLALEAMQTAMADPQGTYETVGSKLKTIAALLPNYRHEAEAASSP